MTGELLYSRSEMFIAVLLFAFLMGASATGYRLGRRGRASIDEATKSQAGSIQGAILGLLGLLLGFTFAMAVSRFDTRKQLVIDEANAIGTAALRARLLPSAQREEARTLFRRYVDARLAEGPPREEADRLEEQLWSLAIAVAETDTRSVTAGLFIESLNEAIDSKSRRDAALTNHVPESVLLLVFIVCIVAVAIVGYGAGLAGGRTTMSIVSLSFLIALVVLVIVDLDRPSRGLIRVGQRSMVRLRDDLARARP